MAVSAVVGLVTAVGASVAMGFSATVFFGAFALGAGISAVSNALIPKPDLGSQMRGTTVTTRDAAGPRKIIYGQARVGGNVVFIAHSGDDNKYLHLAVVFATHYINSYEEVWFNDNKIWTASGGFQSDWGTYVTMDTTKLGTAAQSASSVLTPITEWTSDHKLSGIAYIAFKLEWNQDKFPQGVPNITAVIKGKRVFDPRTNVTAYSTNPALCVRDYLLDSTYGLGEINANIDSDALEAAADLCDEQVSLDGGGTQDRYQCNGVIDTSNQIKANIENLLSSMGGRIAYSNGKYFIQGAEYVAPTFSFDESNTISAITIQTKQSRRSVYNGVKGTFISEEKNYKIMDYPAQLSSTYETEDGDPVYLDMPLPFVTNNLQAQRIAKIALLKSRQQVVLSMTVNLSGLKVKVGDTVNITNDRLGYTNKVFEVIDYELMITPSGESGVKLTLIETAAAVYSWTTSDEVDFLSGGELDLYDGRTVDNVTSLAFTEIGFQGPDGQVLSAVELTWTEPDDAFIEFYKIRYNKNGTTDYLYAESREPRVYISGLDITSNYDFRVQAQNLLGVSSTGTTLTDQALNGDTTAPGVPTNTSATGGVQTITAEWDNPDDLDFKHTEVFVNTTDSIPASPTAVVDGEEYIVTGLSGGDTRYFWLKAVDFSGNKSAATASFNGTASTAASSDIADDSIGSDQIADDAVGSDQIADGAVDITAFASGINPVQVVSTLPASAAQGDMAFLTTDNKLYRYNGNAWTLAVDGADVTSGTLPAASIVANSITAGQIAAGAINTDELAANAVTAAKIAVGALQADSITGDVSEHFTFALGRGFQGISMDSLSSTKKTFDVEIDAPSGGVAKRPYIQGVAVADTNNVTGSDFALEVRLKAGKSYTHDFTGYDRAVVSSYGTSAVNFNVYSGNQITSLALGGIWTSSGDDITPVYGFFYDESADETYLLINDDDGDLQNGDWALTPGSGTSGDSNLCLPRFGAPANGEEHTVPFIIILPETTVATTFMLTYSGSGFLRGLNGEAGYLR